MRIEDTAGLTSYSRNLSFAALLLGLLNFLMAYWQIKFSVKNFIITLRAEKYRTGHNISLLAELLSKTARPINFA